MGIEGLPDKMRMRVPQRYEPLYQVRRNGNFDGGQGVGGFDCSFYRLVERKIGFITLA